MVKLPEGFCIDSTEVTRSQYRAWLDGHPSTAGQIAKCGWNDSFVPDPSCMGSPTDPKYVCQENCDNHPQVCIDWCDAYAFCRAMGKRLCGKIGGGSGSPTRIDQSQWVQACSSNFTSIESYQGEFGIPFVCNGKAFWPQSTPPIACGTVPVGSLTTCQSGAPGYEGVYDLSGNVAEFEDSCTAWNDGQDWCNIRGGSFADNDDRLFCNSDIWQRREKVDATIGFRCCSSP